MLKILRDIEMALTEYGYIYEDVDIEFINIIN